MQTDISYDRQNKLLVVKISGRIEFDKIKQFAQESFRSGKIPLDTNALYDLTEVDFSDIDSDFEQRLIMFREQLNRGDAKIACLVSSDLGYGLGRMYEALSDNLPQQVRVFRDPVQAENWLK